MREFLSLLVNSNAFVDGGWSGILVNPQTQHYLQYDRHYYAHGVAFEFNGTQHYKPSERFSRKEVTEQKARDATKKRISKEKHVELILVHAGDLSLDRMRELVGNSLPLRDLSRYLRSISLLENLGRRYRRAAMEGELADAGRNTLPRFTLAR